MNLRLGEYNMEDDYNIQDDYKYFDTLFELFFNL